MPVIKWEPFSEIALLRKQMDALVENFFGREPMGIGADRWAPALDVSETEEDIRVQVDLPGIDEEDLSVTLVGDRLILRGERKSQRHSKACQFHRTERSCGVFERSLAMPATVDADGIRAEYKKGVLTIFLPKKAKAEPREIPIQAEE